MRARGRLGLEAAGQTTHTRKVCALRSTSPFYHRIGSCPEARSALSKLFFQLSQQFSACTVGRTSRTTLVGAASGLATLSQSRKLHHSVPRSQRRFALARDCLHELSWSTNICHGPRSSEAGLGQIPSEVRLLDVARTYRKQRWMMNRPLGDALCWVLQLCQA